MDEVINYVAEMKVKFCKCKEETAAVVLKWKIIKRNSLSPFLRINNTFSIMQIQNNCTISSCIVAACICL